MQLRFQLIELVTSRQRGEGNWISQITNYKFLFGRENFQAYTTMHFKIKTKEKHDVQDRLRRHYKLQSSGISGIDFKP